MTRRNPSSSRAMPQTNSKVSTSTSYSLTTFASNVESEYDDDFSRDSSPSSALLHNGVSVRRRTGQNHPGSLGHWLFATPLGWQIYVGLLLVGLWLSSSQLLFMNRIILWTGVYKFPYPLMTTLVESLFTHGLLICLAILTRLFSWKLDAWGLSAAVAPSSATPHGAQKKGEEDEEQKTWGGAGAGASTMARVARYMQPSGIAGGGLLEFDLGAVRQTLPAAAAFVARTALSNMSFAYAQLPIYLLARIAIVPLSVALSSAIGGRGSPSSRPPSVPVVSAALTATLDLLLGVLRSHVRVTWESIITGVLSSFFVALFPFVMLRAYDSLVASASSSSSAAAHRGDSAADLGAPSPDSRPESAGTQAEESRAAWRLLHYTSTISILILIPVVLVSGEVRNIIRNCYFLDTLEFWLMIIIGGVTSFATFVLTFVALLATSPLTTTFMFIPRAAYMLPIISRFKMPMYSWVGIGLCWVSCLWFMREQRREGRYLAKLNSGM